MKSLEALRGDLADARSHARSAKARAQKLPAGTGYGYKMRRTTNVLCEWLDVLIEDVEQEIKRSQEVAV